MDWTTGLEYWTGTLDQTTTRVHASLERGECVGGSGFETMCMRVRAARYVTIFYVHA